MKIVKSILPYLIILLICLISWEILMIVLEPYLSKGTFQYDSDLGFRVRPYANGSNRFGFNAKDFPLQKRPHSYRIVIISDSFNWMGGHTGNYTVFINNKFQQYFGDDRVDVINVGYYSTHTGEQLAMLKKYAIRYNPDLVFLGFFAGNDFLDADRNRKRIVVNDLFIDIDRRHELTWFGYPIVPRSRLLCFVEQKYKILKELLKGHTGAPAPQGAFSEETFLSVERNSFEFCNLKLQRSGRWDPNKDYIFDSIDEMQAMLQARNIKFMVGIYPDQFQVNQQLFAQIMVKYHLNKDDYDVDIIQNILKGFLEQKGIQYVDLLEKFQEVGKSRTLYNYQDTHWNEAGNQLAGKIIFPELLKSLPSDILQKRVSSN